MKILFWPRYERLGASSRVRAYQYLPYLEAHGVEATVSPFSRDSYLQSLYGNNRKSILELIISYIRRICQIRMATGYDLVWIEKEFAPFFPSWVEYLLNKLGIPFVVDYDDAIFHRYKNHRRSLVRALLGNKIDRVMRRATLVIAGNDYLAEHARSVGAKRVAYLPSVVDLDRYPSERCQKSDVFTIGWIGSPSTVPYLNLVESALAKVCENGKARLVLVGSGDRNLPEVPLEVHPWSEDTEISEICSFDVGIMPLTDDPWESGKCGYKLIQCMACGLPVVASPVGANNKIVTHGVDGLLASTEEEWTQALITLRDNHEMCSVMGRAAREKVAKEFSLQTNAPRLLALLQSAAKESR